GETLAFRLRIVGSPRCAPGLMRYHHTRSGSTPMTTFSELSVRRYDNGRLKPAPASRLRRAFLHLYNSIALLRVPGTHSPTVSCPPKAHHSTALNRATRGWIA